MSYSLNPLRSIHSGSQRWPQNRPIATVRLEKALYEFV